MHLEIAPHRKRETGIDSADRIITGMWFGQARVGRALISTVRNGGVTGLEEFVETVVRCSEHEYSSGSEGGCNAEREVSEMKRDVFDTISN
jgi:hypothetical protein